MNQTQLLSILIPVYNEQAYLAKIVDRIIQAPIPGNLRRELVMVNDASTDQTAEVMESLQKQYPDLIRIFHQPFNQGKGAAIRRAIQEMNGHFAIIQDADLEYDPNEYPIVLRPLLEGYADVVYGSRFATREMRKVLFYHHKLGNMFLTHFSNLTTGLDLTDMETCYKAFRGEILKSIPLRSNRFGIEPEITAKIAKRGLSVYEVPISYHGRRYSEGKKIGWKDGISALMTILKYWIIDDCYRDSIQNPCLHHSMEQCRNFSRLIIKKSLPYFGLKILEIGSGIGNISKLLPQKERLTLSDVKDENLTILRNSYEGNAIVDIQKFDFDSSPSFESVYDTVLLYNQLEHSADPIETLRHIHSFLGQDGRLIMTVAKECGFIKPLKTFGGLQRRFSKKSIRNLLDQTGFQLEVCETFNFPGQILWEGKRLFDSQNETRFGRFSLKCFDTFLPWANWLGNFGREIPYLKNLGANYFIVAKQKEVIS